MDKTLKKIINVKEEYAFKELYGFTFVFKKTFIFNKFNIVSAEIKAIAIIYYDEPDYFLSPLSEIESLDEIVKEYVKTI